MKTAEEFVEIQKKCELILKKNKQLNEMLGDLVKLGVDIDRTYDQVEPMRRSLFFNVNVLR